MDTLSEIKQIKEYNAFISTLKTPDINFKQYNRSPTDPRDMIGQFQELSGLQLFKEFMSFQLNSTDIVTPIKTNYSLNIHRRSEYEQKYESEYFLNWSEQKLKKPLSEMELNSTDILYLY
tara:strand:- start:286 stop:645 length:360 start_codon:yes stop_codon:yes gene_type:complete